MTARGKLKTSYEFTPKVKVRLSKLKLDLKLRGLTGVSEASILEALIEAATLDELEAHFKRRRR
jgi:hypothetical protein